MKPLYDGQENHYKKMLDLQEKLRRSEEERIRLEERFNHLVQESRNRHQACINRLRICYVEFLEEQKARDQRNNKILVTLNKVDSSLALMTAKTERLNVLRKQYEAYLLRTYGNQRPNGSVTADSGMESQQDQEIPPSPIFPKSVQVIPRVAFPYANQEFAASNYKLPNLDNQSLRKFTLAESPTDTRRNSTIKFPLAASSPLLHEDPSSFLKHRFLLSTYLDNPLKYSSSPKSNVRKDDSYLDNHLKYTSIPKPEVRKDDNVFKTFSTRSPEASSPDHDLDQYIGKIKRLHAEHLLQNQEQEERKHEQSFEDADYEQNTSGDLLNVTLSEDGLESSAEDERGRVRRARQAFVSSARNTPIERNTRNVPVSSERRASDVHAFSAIDKFSQPEIASSQQRDIKAFAQEQERVQQQQQPAAIENALAKLMSLDEARRLIHQNRDLQEEPPLTDKRETQDLAEIEQTPDQESKNDNDGIEDDYDDTVDIDSWMPDDLEQQVQEVRLQDDILDRPRRKLESIEEVEQPEDEEPVEEDKDEKPEEVDEVQEVIASDAEEDDDEKEIKELEEARDSQERLQEKKEEEAKDQKKTYNDNEEYTNDQQYYQQENGEQQQYQENAEYLQNYNQQQDDQQQYQYSDDPNQQYAYDPNADYSGYENQQYVEGQYGDYDQYQYDPNQTYEQDSNQQYQQYGAEYEAYQDMQAEQGYTEQPDQNQYDPNQAYDYLQQPQAYDQESMPQSSEMYGSDQQIPKNDCVEVQPQPEPANQESKETSEDKKKKDVIKSILDSDTESFIERNLSNTESDFDFN